MRKSTKIEVNVERRIFVVVVVVDRSIYSQFEAASVHSFFESRQLNNDDDDDEHVFCLKGKREPKTKKGVFVD